MTTTNLSEKERKIRKNLRIKETLERNGDTWFSPQMKLLGMWFYFDEHTTSWTNLVFTTYFKRYSTLEKAREAVDKYVNYKLAKPKVVYHNVNYLTH